MIQRYIQFTAAWPVVWLVMTVLLIVQFSPAYIHTALANATSLNPWELRLEGYVKVCGNYVG